MTAPHPRKRRWGTPDLDLSTGLRFALRQDVPLSVDLGPRVQAVARAVLDEAGFERVRRSGPSGRAIGAPFGQASAWVGERGVRRRGGTASNAIPPIVTLFLAGCILGGLDAYILGSLLAGALWVLVSAGAAGAFWLLYGRLYDSDVAMVTFSDPLSGTPSRPGSVSVIFWAARVRSHIHSGVRVPTIVSAPMRLATEVGVLSREFQRRMMSEPAGGEPYRSVPS
ncbi:MAG: hypothetical protein WBW47_04800 [Thermoplasmata archaeon]